LIAHMIGGCGSLVWPFSDVIDSKPRTASRLRHDTRFLRRRHSSR
jgi:hypothetical protein